MASVVRSGVFIEGLLDPSSQRIENLIDIGSFLRADFQKGHAVLLGEPLTLLLRNFPLPCEIYLVSD